MYVRTLEYLLAKSSEYWYYNSEFEEEEKTQENRYFDLTTFLWTNCATAKLNFLKKSNNAEKYDVHGGLKFQKSAI